MRVLFSYFPHYSKEKGFLLLSQNRFAKYRGTPELIYPLIPASGLTLLKNNNYDTHYLDGIFEKLTIDEYIQKLSDIGPDILIFETKTPSVKRDWGIIEILKTRFKNMVIICCGDHVSVLPEETMENSKVDYIILGGDYDYGMLQICNFLNGKTKFPKGIVYRNSNGNIVNPGKPLFIPCLDDLPIIDREVIPWRNYHEAWRLYDKFTYMYGSRGCPYKCSFCSWPQMLYGGKVRFRKPEKIVEEMELLVRQYGIKEIFFDDGTFTCNKNWVLEICSRIKEKKLEILWSCNGRVDNVDNSMLHMMKKSGCRLIKYGVESANQKTIDIIKKGYTIDQVKKAFLLTQKEGILIHSTAMIGFPWESKKEMQKTIDFIKTLNPDTCQFSIPVSYPGTELFRQAEANGWLRFGRNWEHYDMEVPPLEHPLLKPEEITALCKRAWLSIYFSPLFIMRKIKRLKDLLHLRWYFRGLISLLKGHLNLKF